MHWQIGKKIRQVIVSKLPVLFGRSDGIRTHDYQEKYSRLTRLERFVILLIFLLLRLPSSATGGGRLRHLVPHIGTLRKEVVCPNPVLNYYKIKKSLTPEGIREFFWSE